MGRNCIRRPSETPNAGPASLDSLKELRPPQPIVLPFQILTGCIIHMLKMNRMEIPARIRIYAYISGEDDPRKCTARKMIRLGFAREIRDIRRIPRNAVLLDPTSKRAFSPEDRAQVVEGGIAVLDFSWKRLDTMPHAVRSYARRALPYLLASNPLRWGRPAELSSVEAVAAALFIIGEREMALNLLSKFSWGTSFLKLNMEPLLAYAEAANSTQVVEAQYQFLK